MDPVKRLEQAINMDPAQPSPPTTLPHDSTARREIPIVQGVLQYFPAALAEVAKVSKMGAIKHSSGTLTWTRPGPATYAEVNDHLDCVGRHLIEHGEGDGEDAESGLPALAHAAWRALAALQVYQEANGGAPTAANAVIKEPF